VAAQTTRCGQKAGNTPISWALGSDELPLFIDEFAHGLVSWEQKHWRLAQTLGRLR
jgi:hypothetical protein